MTVGEKVEQEALARSKEIMETLNKHVSSQNLEIVEVAIQTAFCHGATAGYEMAAKDALDRFNS